jgi:hypothetical protein
MGEKEQNKTKGKWELHTSQFNKAISKDYALTFIIVVLLHSWFLHSPCI